MIPGSVISASIRGSASFPGGQTWGILADAIGNAFVSWASTPGNVILQGVTAGIVGAGSVTGVLTLTGGPALVVSGLSGGLSGVTVPQVGTAIGTGLISALSGSIQYQGVSVGVGSGTDVSFVSSANAVSLSSLIQAAHVSLTAGRGGSGANYPAFYTALGTGIASLIQTAVTLPGTGIVTPSGALGPSSSSGTSLSTPV